MSSLTYLLVVVLHHVGRHLAPGRQARGVRASTAGTGRRVPRDRGPREGLRRPATATGAHRGLWRVPRRLPAPSLPAAAVLGSRVWQASTTHELFVCISVSTI